jgi:predicted secreted Zn-dependent protease
LKHENLRRKRSEATESVGAPIGPAPHAPIVDGSAPSADVAHGHAFNALTVLPAAESVARETESSVLSVSEGIGPTEPRIQRAPDPNAPAGDPPPASPGAPAEPMGPGAAGTGTTKFDIKPNTRVVSGSTLTNLWTALTNNGAREAASVLPKLTPEPKYDYDDQDRVKNVTVFVVEQKEMPEWQEFSAQCQPIQAEWTRYFGVLDAHENRHIEIDRKHFGDVHKKLIGKKREDAFAALDAEVDAADKENQAYDTSSKNGINEGAIIRGAVQCAPEKVKSTAAESDNENPAVASAGSATEGAVQTKSLVGGDSGPLEQEADAAADLVMHSVPAPAIQRACAAPGPCECESCRKKAEEQRRSAGGIQAKLSVSQPGDPDEEEAERVAEHVMRVAATDDHHDVARNGSKRLNRHESGDAPARAQEVNADVAAVTRGSGQSLDAETRAFMEPRFGFDFSRVRIHSDEQSAETAESVGARAFTFGSHVVFGRGHYAPQTTEGQHLIAHELAHVVQQGATGGGTVRQRSVIARAVDPSKAEPLRAELDSPWYVSNSTLENLWASLGVDLIEAVNDSRPLTSDTGKNKKKESYRDLWWRSTLEQNINLTAASRPVLTAFATDTVEVAKAQLSSQQTRLENLQQELKNAADQKAADQKAAQKPAASPASPTSSVSPEDANAGLSKNTAPKPIANAQGLIDSATFVHFLQNWESLLKTSPVGMRRVDTSNLVPQPATPAATPAFNPLPNAPPTPQAASPDAGLQPILFDPSLTIEKVLESPNVESLDREAFAAVSAAFKSCTERNASFKETIAAMLAEDANLAVLNERNQLAQVSALGGRTDDEAAGAVNEVAKQNLETVKTFLKMLGTPGEVDWKALRPIHAQLLSGSGGKRNWSELVARTFVEGYFKREAEAEREAAERQLKINLVIGGVAFIAMLSPAAPLAAAVLGATSAYAAGNLAASMAASAAADKNANALGAGAAAGVVDKDDARRAKEAAEAKKVSGLEILLTVLPFLPGIAKMGARAAGAVGGLGRQARWARIAAEASAVNAAETEAGAATAATTRPRATVQEIRGMLANNSEYYTWRTPNKNLAANGTIRFTGETNPMAPKGIYLAKGVKGLPYGDYVVAIKGSNFPIKHHPMRAEEFLLEQEIRASEGVWYTHADYLEAIGGVKKP